MIFRAKDIINWLKRSAFRLITLLHYWQCRRSSRNHSSISLCMAWVEQKNPRKNPGGKDLTDWFRASISGKVTYYLSDCHWRKICCFLSPCRQGGKEYVSWVWKLIRSIKVSTADLDCSTDAAAATVTWTKTYKDEYCIINQGLEGGLTTMTHPCLNSDLECV